ncbi:MAG: pilus assembly PilX family protein [Candidatus Saccharimonadales bacterium]
MKQSLKNKRQAGMVSIIVTTLLMVIITLVVIGFAAVTRREQRQVLDNQLNTQAFYAAESGVNDAIHAIQFGTLPSNQDVTSCTDPIFTPSMHQIDTSNNVSYTCLLVSQSPSSLNYQVQPNTSINANMRFLDSAGNPANARYITVSWQDRTGNANGYTANGGYPGLPPVGDWQAATQIALLRAELTDFGSGFSRNILNAHTFTAFLYPSTANNPATITYAPNNNPANWRAQGVIDQVKCDSVVTKLCTAKIDLGAAGMSHIYLRLGAIYNYANIFITAEDGAGGNLDITGAQAVIDSTGKAQDVLRRIVVHAPLSSASGEPTDFAVQSVEGICKQLQINRGSHTATYGCPRY